MPPIRRSAYLLTLITFAFLVLSLVWHSAPPTAFVGVTTGEVPRRIGKYLSLGDNTIAPEVQAALSSADILSRTYSIGPSATGDIDFLLIGGTDRNALHDPRACLVGAGWRLDDDHLESLPGSGIEIRTCKAVRQSGGADYDIVYLYDVGGQIRNRVTDIRAEMLVSALIGRRNRPVYFLRVLLPLAKDPATRLANHQQLLAFAADARGRRLRHGSPTH